MQASDARKKVPTGCPGQVDFPSGQEAFHSHFPLSITSVKEQTLTCPGQTKFQTYLSQGQAGIQDYFLNPDQEKNRECFVQYCRYFKRENI